MTEKRIVPMEMVELEEESIHMLVKAGFAGLENLWWVVDTGASKSVLDKAVAVSVAADPSEGIMATGLGMDKVETSSGVIPHFTLSGHRFDPLRVAIVDLDHINREYARFCDKKMAGLLGSDFFLREKAVIDYDSLVIRFK